MRTLAVVVSIIFLHLNLAAQSEENTAQKEGFILGLSVGGGVISLSEKGQEDPFNEAYGGISLPNLKFGWMVSERMAIMGSFTGMSYELEGEDRSFDAFMPSVQYWFKDRWWVNGGVCLALDAPSLFEDTDSDGDNYHFGCTLAVSTGYEILRRDKFVMDLQSRVQLGRVFMENDKHRDAAVFSLGVGFNWY